MYNVLIVDDEWYAVQAIVKKVRWAELNVTGVFEAYDTDEAIDICTRHPVDVIVCDIEMPGESGLELCRWVNEERPLTPCILVTGHANFEYARGGIGAGPKRIAAMLAEHHLPESLMRRRIRLVLISVEQWHKPFDGRDEDIMTYALKCAAKEIIVRDADGDVIQDRSGILFALLYLDDAEAGEEAGTEAGADAAGAPGAGGGASRLADDCGEFIRACNRYFYCDVSCYFGEPKPIAGIADMYHVLLEAEHGNVARTNAVIELSGNDRRTERAEVVSFVTSIRWNDWAEMIELGRKREVLHQIDGMFERLREEAIHSELIKALYHAFLHMVYHLSHKRGLSVRKLVGETGLLEDPAPQKSFTKLHRWALRLVGAAADGIGGLKEDHSAVIGKVKQYIEDRLQDVTRERIAEHVYLNPAYLSRLFKKETGQSLIEYIIAAKMRRAKSLLATSNIKISEIGASVGYDNFSYFTKTFKKMTGVTPQEYRKKYQQ